MRPHEPLGRLMPRLSLDHSMGDAPIGHRAVDAWWWHNPFGQASRQRREYSTAVRTSLTQSSQPGKKERARDPPGSRAVLEIAHAIEIETNQEYWGVDFAVTDSNFKFADYVDETCKVYFLGGLGVLRGIYPSF